MSYPYVIWAPPYFHSSAGVRAQFVLCALLRSEGQQASIQIMDNAQPLPPDRWIDSPHDAPPATGLYTADTIDVYPETLAYDPSGRGRYVRWLLGPADRDGLCFQWLPSMGDWPVLHVPVIETDLFFPGSSDDRAGTGVWVGKASRAHEDLHLPADGLEIGRGDPPTRSGLADLFRRLERLVSLDPFSVLNVEAALCGCPVRAYTERGRDRAWLESRYSSTAGIVFDDEPWAYAEATAGTVAYSQYQAADEAKRATVRRFIRITQET